VARRVGPAVAGREAPRALEPGAARAAVVQAAGQVPAEALDRVAQWAKAVKRATPVRPVPQVHSRFLRLTEGLAM